MKDPETYAQEKLAEYGIIRREGDGQWTLGAPPVWVRAAVKELQSEAEVWAETFDKTGDPNASDWLHTSTLDYEDLCDVAVVCREFDCYGRPWNKDAHHCEAHKEKDMVECRRDSAGDQVRGVEE